MNTLKIEPELYNRIEKAAQDNKADIGEFVKQAIQQYILRLTLDGPANLTNVPTR